MIISVLKIFFLDATFLLRFSVYYCIHSIRIKKSQPYSSRTSLVVEEDKEYPLQQL
jgi:hypothetical protein